MLHHHIAIEAGVACAKYFTRAACSKLCDNLVGTESTQGLQPPGILTNRIETGNEKFGCGRVQKSAERRHHGEKELIPP
jgi:hypothetical protein